MNKEKICVVGLGYVGLPLANLLSSRFKVTGFDINKQRINELKQGIDRTNEIDSDILKTTSIEFTYDDKKIQEAKIIIVTVPTPVDEYKRPDLTPVKKASETIAKNMSKGVIVVYESTVYPGVTEDICIPILEQESGLKWKQDFNVGYSPERINPGDKLHPLDKIKKIVSGDTNETLEILSTIYGSVIIAGIHKAPNIKTAEAAKVIENTQRDLNIALVNELALISHKIGIDTRDVLEAAGTKWNFLKFEPGLVGGHCIGVDPYYLTFKAESIGYHPQVILAGRRINDNMGKYIAENTIKKLIEAEKQVKKSNVLILGLTFKEDIADIRNTKVIDIYNELKEYGVNVHVYDPNALTEEVKHEYNIDMLDDVYRYKYDAIIIAVKHNSIKEKMKLEDYQKLSNGKTVIIDVKGLYNYKDAKKNDFLYWRL